MASSHHQRPSFLTASKIIQTTFTVGRQTFGAMWIQETGKVQSLPSIYEERQHATPEVQHRIQSAVEHTDYQRPSGKKSKDSSKWENGGLLGRTRSLDLAGIAGQPEKGL